MLPGTFRTMACSCPLGETQLNCLLKQKENKQKEILVLKEAIQSWIMIDPGILMYKLNRAKPMT